MARNVPATNDHTTGSASSTCDAWLFRDSNQVHVGTWDGQQSELRRVQTQGAHQPIHLARLGDVKQVRADVFPLVATLHTAGAGGAGTEADFCNECWCRLCWSPAAGGGAGGGGDGHAIAWGYVSAAPPSACSGNWHLASKLSQTNAGEGEASTQRCGCAFIESRCVHV